MWVHVLGLKSLKCNYQNAKIFVCTEKKTAKHFLCEFCSTTNKNMDKWKRFNKNLNLIFKIKYQNNIKISIN